MQPQTEEQRGERACALTAKGSISRAMKGLVSGWSSSGARQKVEALDCSPDSSKPWPRYTSHGRGASSSSTRCLGWRQIQGSPPCCKRTRAQQDRNRLDPSFQTGTHKCTRTHA